MGAKKLNTTSDPREGKSERSSSDGKNSIVLIILTLQESANYLCNNWFFVSITLYFCKSVEYKEIIIKNCFIANSSMQYLG
jgi:hypothetical protein